MTKGSVEHTVSRVVPGFCISTCNVCFLLFLQAEPVFPGSQTHVSHKPAIVTSIYEDNLFRCVVAIM